MMMTMTTTMMRQTVADTGAAVVEATVAAAVVVGIEYAAVEPCDAKCHHHTDGGDDGDDVDVPA